MSGNKLGSRSALTTYSAAFPCRRRSARSARIRRRIWRERQGSGEVILGAGEASADWRHAAPLTGKADAGQRLERGVEPSALAQSCAQASAGAQHQRFVVQVLKLSKRAPSSLRVSFALAL